MLGTLLIVAVIAILPAAIAKSKGRSFVLWYLYGVAFWLLAVPHALLLMRKPKVTDMW